MTPQHPAAPEGETDARFWANVDRTDDSGCWLWLAGQNGDGYGSFTAGGRTKLTHRLAYELTRGPIPKGLQIDHLCRVRHCVNPDHLEPVTPRENTLRGISGPAINATKTHCPRGHEYTPENTYVYRGSRHCRACQPFRKRKVKPLTPEQRQRKTELQRNRRALLAGGGA